MKKNKYIEEVVELFNHLKAERDLSTTSVKEPSTKSEIKPKAFKIPIVEEL